MSGARGRALLIGLIALLAIAAVLFAFASRPAKPVQQSRHPTLMLLTSLPLVFGDDFSLGGGGSPALTALQKQYRVVTISTTSPRELAQGRLLLMAQPQAQTAENLVALDDWVRNGGRVLLLADPMLEWPSNRPLGDPTRPAMMFADTGLLAHWGLTLDAPDQRGPQPARIDGEDVMTVSPGRLVGTGCQVSADGLVAHCRLGKGMATVIADADLLDVGHLDGTSTHNLDAVIAELDSLAR